MIRIYSLISNKVISRNCALIFIIIIGFGFTASGQVDRYKKGIVIDSIQVGNTPETYALYLPESFEHNRLSAIVFILDPVGRGRAGIEPFKSAAEKYNYILVCSNNSRNGPFTTNFEVINRLFDNVFSTFNIDEKQIYMAGFSGGSRLATAIAVLTDQIQGVIACGAGFSPEMSHVPLSKKAFSYIGLVGERDMNYHEMFEVSDWLDRFQIENEIYTYDDDHRWPQEEHIDIAFGWLEMQAYKRNLRKWDDDLVLQIFLSNVERASSSLGDQHYLRASREYESILNNFGAVYTLDSIRSKLTQIRSNSNYHSERKQFNDLKEEEEKIKSIYSERFNRELNSKKTLSRFNWWEKRFSEIDREIKITTDRARSNMLKRIQYSIYAMIIETSYRELRSKQVEKALYCHHLVALMLPNRPFIFYNLAKDYALLDEKENSLEFLKLAISKGFKNKEGIMVEEAFQKYMDTEEMRVILESF